MEYRIFPIVAALNSGYESGIAEMGLYAMQIAVECSAEYGEEEVPRRFWIGTKRIEVQALLDRWPGVDHRYFKVRGDDAAIYILRRDVTSSVWTLVFFSVEDISRRDFR